MKPLTKHLIMDSATTSRPWPLLPALLALAACWLILAWPWLSGEVTIPWDAKAHFEPQIQFLAASIARGESPFWAPYVFSGHPQVADPQSLIFSPPFLALATLSAAPSSRQFDATVLLQILMGAAALVLWFRDKRWHWAGALIAGLAFAFGAAMAWRIQHIEQVVSLSYFPLVMLLLERALTRSSLGYGIGAGIVAGFMVLGRDQVALINVYFLIGLVAWHWFSEGITSHKVGRSLPPLVAGGLGGLIVILVPVLLTAVATAASNRPSIDFISAGRGSLHPALLLTLFAPDVFGASGEMGSYWGPPSFAWKDTGLFIAQNMGELYIGAVPLLLLLFGTVSGVFWAREIRYFSIAALVVLLYALGWYTPVFKLMHAVVPGVDLYRRPADAVFPLGLILAILSGYALHRLFSGTFPRLGRTAMGGVAAVVVVALGYAVHLALHFDAFERAIVPIGTAAGLVGAAAAILIAVTWLAPRQAIAGAALVAAFTVGDLAWSNGPNGATGLPPATYEVLQPSTANDTIALLKRKLSESRSDTRRDRVELAGLGFHWPNASLTHRLENTLGYNPVRYGLYSDATGAEDTVGLPSQRKFSALFPSYDSTVANLLGLRYIATGVPIQEIDAKLTPGELCLIARTRDGFVYENPDALPRVLFASDARPADFDRLLADGTWPKVDFKRTVLLDATALPSARGPRRPGSARIVSYHNTEIVLETTSPDGGWLVLNDVWHPWWAADVDGQRAEMLRANVLFRAVEVPPGRHRVRFEFQPLRGAVRDALAMTLGHSG